MYILIANVGYMIFFLFRKGTGPYGGYIAQLFTFLCFMVLIVVRQWEGLGTVLLSIFGMFAFLGAPAILQRRIDSLMAQQRFGEIESPAQWKAWLAWSELNQHLLELSRIGSKLPEAYEETVTALHAMLGKGDPYDEMTRLFLAMIHFHARKFDRLLTHLLSPTRTFADYTFEELLYIVRSLLETGRFDEALSAQMEMERKIADEGELNPGQAQNLLISRLLFFAFMGWQQDFDELAASNAKGLEELPPPLRAYWSGVAAFHSGSFDKGQELMQSALTQEWPDIPDLWLQWMKQRLQDLTENREFFLETVRPRLETLRTVHREAFQAILRKSAESAVPIEIRDSATRYLFWANLIVFSLLYATGNLFDLVGLINCGANFGVLVRQGEWFRLVTHQFLHMGWLHLTMNLLALKYLGPPIETYTGWPMFFGIYLFSGICGGLATALGGDRVSVGASGAILGLLAAAIVLEISGVGPRKSFDRKGYLSSLFFIVVANLVIGFLEKGIDNNAHIGGMVGGAIAGLAAVICLRSPFLKSLASILALVFTIGVFGGSAARFQEFRRNFRYPAKRGPLLEATQKDWPFVISVPEGWAPDSNRLETQFVYLFNGPIGERLLIQLRPEMASATEFLQNHADEFTREIVDDSDLKFIKRRGPTEHLLDGRKAFQLRFWFSQDGIPQTERHFFLFGDDFTIFVRFSLPTAHEEAYDEIINSMIGSIRIKGESRQ